MGRLGGMGSYHIPCVRVVCVCVLERENLRKRSIVQKTNERLSIISLLMLSLCLQAFISFVGMDL